MRPQWCREHIDETAEHCGLDDETKSRVKKVAKFCATNPQFCDCATAPIFRLISIRDEPVKNRAISLAKNALNEETPTGGKKRDKLTEPEVKKIIQKAEMEIRGELTKKYEEERKAKPATLAGQMGMPESSFGDQIRADEMKAAETSQPHVNPGSKVTINPVVINDTHRQQSFQTATDLKAKAAGGIAGGSAATNPGMDGPAPIQRGDPQTLTITCTDKQWAVLKQVQREGQADSFEEAVLWLIDEAGDRMECE